ncbi:hypothetical protein RND81_13G099400 [Saponaria officinalis]|uniref:Uncharacterized protein n=1 Tax=Saponaria officinalis TaxID=3572 RepID=A0AAW1H1F5_SAPOF
MSSTDDSMQVNSSDLIATKMVSNVFDGNSFAGWKRGMLIALSAKNKLWFVDGSNTKPDSKSPSSKTWQRCNDLVFSWILNSESEEIANSILYCEIAKKAWDELEERFGHTCGAQLYGIHKKLNDFSQGNDSVSTCFTKIKQIWDEIDVMGMNPSCVCTCACSAAEKQKKFQQDQRVVQFLMCLNDTYSEERQREIQSSASNFQTNSASFYAKEGYRGQIQNNSGNNTQFRGGEIKCNYCKRLGHTIDKCRKLQYKNNVRRYANAAQYPDDSDHGGLMEAFDSKVDTTVINLGVNNELCSQFMKFLKQQQQQHGMPNSDSSITANFAGTTADFAGNTSASNTLPKPYTISIPNVHIVTINILGTMMLIPDICLKDVLFVPSFKFNLLSASSIRKPIILGKSHTNLYVFQQVPLTSTTKSSFSNSAVIVNSAQTWHSRLGNLPLYKLKKLSCCNTSEINEKDFHSCSICAKARQHRLLFLDSHIQTSGAFELIHIDLWGPYPIQTYNGHKYFLTIVDDFTRTTWTHLLSFKSNAFTFIQSFISLNGVVERKHKHLLETARALIFQSRLPRKYWGECILTATYIINSLPTKILAFKSLYKLLFKSPPSLHHMRAFGCLCYSPKPGRDKFSPRAIPSIFLGYPFGKKAYKFLNLENFSVFNSRDVVFHEHIFPFVKNNISDSRLFPDQHTFPFSDHTTSDLPPTPHISPDTSPSPVPHISPEPSHSPAHVPTPTPLPTRHSTRPSVDTQICTPKTNPVMNQDMHCLLNIIG